MLWRSCIGPPSQPKLALSLPIKGPSFCRLTVVGGSAAFGSENRTTSLRSMEMHPFWCCAPLPPVGEVCSPLFLVLTYVAHFIAPLESPPPGETPPQAAEGVHFPSPARAVCLFSRGRSPVVKVLSILAAEPPTTTLTPAGRVPACPVTFSYRTAAAPLHRPLFFLSRPLPRCHRF